MRRAKAMIAKTVPPGFKFNSADKPNWGFLYLAGGNPPIAPGLFDDMGNRLAFWPADVEASQENFEIVMRLIWKREDEKPLTRGAIREAFLNPDRPRWGVWCETWGGVTGHREAWLKNRDGGEVKFDDLESAKVEARRCLAERQGHGYVQFAFTAKEYK